MFKLSVIIPVYNVESYLEKCVNSVISQNISNIEIILVNDGSTDSSPSICETFSKMYDYVKVIHKKNGGLSSARNEGIRSANGEYLMFLDSDDWWNKNVSVSAILNCLFEDSGCEMVLFNILNYYENDGYYKRVENFNFNKIPTNNLENYYSFLLNSGNLQVSACTKILLKSFILNNELFFKEGIKGEDNEWMIRLLRSVQKIKVIDEDLYIYRKQRKGSITNTINSKSIFDLLTIINDSLHYSVEHKNKITNLELGFCSYLWFVALGLSTHIKQIDKKTNDFFKKTKDIVIYSKSRKTKICNIFIKCFGFRITKFILKIYLTIKSKNRLSIKEKKIYEYTYIV